MAVFYLNFVVITLLLQVRACIKYVDEEKNKDVKAFWEEEPASREIEQSCECGHRSNNDLPWNVFIHIPKIIDYHTGNPIVCLGTIINSNFILTSHSCLTHSNHTINMYDTWKPKNGLENVIYSPDDLIVSENFDLNDTGEILQVEEIIYNNRYPFSSINNSFSFDDIVIIKVTSDFTDPKSNFSSICVPDESFQDIKLHNKIAVYYGAGTRGNLPFRKATWLENYIRYGEGGMCEDVFDRDARILCIYYFNEGSCGPFTVGSPLILSPDGVGFLLGISTTITIDEFEYANVFFPNILNSLKYLNHYAKVHRSKWCKFPQAKIQPDNHQFPMEDSFAKATKTPFGNYTWDSGPFSRDESLDCTCGIGNSKETSSRIASGVTAEPYEFPWMANILVFNIDEHPSLCGGSIINDRMILTAAHCIVDSRRVSRKYRNITIPQDKILLSVNIHKRLNDPNKQLIPVKNVTIHPDNVDSIREGCFRKIRDVALLELETPLSFPSSGHGLRPICLPKPTAPIEVVGKTGTVTGWGLTIPGDRVGTSLPEELQKIQLQINSVNYCAEAAGYGNYPGDLFNTESVPLICAGTLNPFKDSGQGDSGGPLSIFDEGKKQWTQVGIVSVGVNVVDLRTNEAITAAYYEDVQRYLNFIDYNAKQIGTKWCRAS